MQQSNSKFFTYQTRLKFLDNESEELLTKTATHLSKVQRALFIDFLKGKSLTSLKNDYLKKYSITARQFNSLRIELEGKIRSYKEVLNERLSLLKAQVDKLKKQLPHLKNRFKIHQKKRRLVCLEKKLQTLGKDKEENKIRLCFGGKKLFHSQFHLKENGYENFLDWKKDWKNARDGKFFLVGSKDESFGNQSCQLIKEGNLFILKVRLPNIFANKSLIIKNIEFSYGKEEIEKYLKKNGKKELKNLGKAINYRFIKDKKGWTLFVSIEKTSPDLISRENYGSIGVDLNANHIALAETDRFGNIVKKSTIKCSTYGKTSNARKALINEVCKKVVDYAKEVKKPIVVEKLDFWKKKQTLKDLSNKQSRLLSSFAYKQFFSSLESRAFKEGIGIYKVNPAYSTIIGEIKFKTRYGLSSHQSAALVLARRKNYFSEDPPAHIEIYEENFKTAFSLPEWNREKHVWSFYREVSKKKKAAHVVHLSTKRSLNICDSKIALVGYG